MAVAGSDYDDKVCAKLLSFYTADVKFAIGNEHGTRKEAKTDFITGVILRKTLTVKKCTNHKRWPGQDATN